MKKFLLVMAFTVVSFWSGAQTRNVTFRVDMSTYTGTFTTPEVNGTWNSWCGNCNAMSPTSTPGIWSVTLPLAQGTALEYKFSHDNWAGQEMNNPAVHAPMVMHNSPTVYLPFLPSTPFCL